MPCPYAERRGALIYCKASGKTVNPLTFPCLSDRYTACRYYKEARAKAGEAAGKPTAAAAPRAAPARVEERPQPPRGVMGVRRDGSPPSACSECVFYVKTRSWCLLLGEKVEDPQRPPCAG